MSSFSEPRILVVGAGSAGERHARLLRALGASVAITDPVAERAQAVVGAETLRFDPELGSLGEFDGVVIAGPTSVHREQAERVLAEGRVVLVEKPLAASAAGLDDLVETAGDSLTVGYNLRLHRPVERFRELLDDGVAGRVAHVRLWFGSHLPDWRPHHDYRSSYSARAALGGGILLDASHEIDLLLWMFGERWSVAGAVMARRSRLEIDVEDVATALLRDHEGLPAVVAVDAVSRRYRRGIEVVGDEATIRLDWGAGRIEVDTQEGTTVEDADRPIEESYRRQAEAFLDLVAGRATPVVPARDGAAVVALCDDIRRAAEWEGAE